MGGGDLSLTFTSLMSSKPAKACTKHSTRSLRIRKFQVLNMAAKEKDVKFLPPELSKNPCKIVDKVLERNEILNQEFTLSDIGKHLQGDPIKCVRFFAAYGLIKNSMTCGSCNEAMRLSLHKAVSDKLEWKCSNSLTCSYIVSIY